MTYAKIENTEIVLISRPQWFSTTGESLTDAELLVHGIYKVTYASPPFNSDYQTLTENPKTEWVVGSTEIEVTYTIANIPLEALRDRRMAAATQKRWEVETGGVTLANGIRIDTKREDQNTVSNAVSVIGLTGLTTVDFKAASGWATVTIADLEGIARATGLFKQACYSAERAHHTALLAIVNSETQTDYQQLIEYDVNQNWPSNILT